MMNFEIWKHISVNFTFTFKHFMQKRSQYYRCWLAVRFKRNSKVQTFKVKLIIDNQTHIKYILFVLVFSSPVYSEYHFWRSWAGWQHIQHCRALKVETLWSLKCLSGNWQAWGQNPIQIPNPRTWAVTKIFKLPSPDKPKQSPNKSKDPVSPKGIGTLIFCGSPKTLKWVKKV